MVLLRLWMIIGCALVLVISPCARAEAYQALESLLSRETRLMVFSPHPDDESLGAGGLMQRVLGLGGKVKVVFLTNGDGFPEGVEKEDHIIHPSAGDYRKYGEERRQEALKALGTLGVTAEDVVFLGFPDGGLCQLLWKYRHDPQVYESPYTLERHPPASEMILPQTDYNGFDLRKELARVLMDFRPTLVAVTPPQDQHPDHKATYCFVRKTLADLQAKPGTSIKPQVITYLVHFGQWPVGQGAGTGSRLNPPEGFPEQTAEWIFFALLPREAEVKRKAILRYHTQMLVMGRYLMSFARANELFMMERGDLIKERGKISCCERK
jgi:LmbE family N-acetylglucosaminyl deacetylase